MSKKPSHTKSSLIFSLSQIFTLINSAFSICSGLFGMGSLKVSSQTGVLWPSSCTLVLKVLSPKSNYTNGSIFPNVSVFRSNSALATVMHKNPDSLGAVFGELDTFLTLRGLGFSTSYQILAAYGSQSYKITCLSSSFHSEERLMTPTGVFL